MKILTLLRHAKSTWDDPIARDFDRPLNPRGRRAAQTVGREMKSQGMTFDHVVASPAQRVVETIEEVETAFGPLRSTYDKRVYLASPETLLEIVRAAPQDAERLLIVGHNPGLEILALLLTREGPSGARTQLEVKYPTGTVAQIELPVERWADVAQGRGTLARFIRPRDLDPELGPDEAG